VPHHFPFSAAKKRLAGAHPRRDLIELRAVKFHLADATLTSALTVPRLINKKKLPFDRTALRKILVGTA